jgi:hypothetical protein
MEANLRAILALVSIVGTFIEVLGIYLLCVWAVALESYLGTIPEVLTCWFMPIIVIIVGWLLVGICTTVVMYFLKPSEKK